MDLKAEIQKLAELQLTDGQFIVDIVLSSRSGPKKVLVLVDGEQGMNIDDCAEISRRLSRALDETDLLRENYMLEVSTPGVDHPLTLKRQYPKHIGRKLKIKLADRIAEGKLTALDDEKLLLEEETGMGKKKEIKSVSIPFSEIEKAFVMVSFK